LRSSDEVGWRDDILDTLRPRRYSRAVVEVEVEDGIAADDTLEVADVFNAHAEALDCKLAVEPTGAFIDDLSLLLPAGRIMSASGKPPHLTVRVG
jgi:hypothetical protein